MNTIARHSLDAVIRSIAYLAVAIAILAAPAYATLAHPAFATAASTTSAVPLRGPHHGGSGPDYWSITGARVGAPSERDVTTYGGSHKHLRVEQQLYGPGIVAVPHVDTTVHQSH